MDDLYKILGISPNASANEIRERYRFLAQAFHPDKFSSLSQKQQAEEEFKKINNAYQILSTPQKREKYDNEKSFHPNYSKNTANNKNRQAEQTTQRKEESHQRTREETAKRDEQRRRSKKWIEANQTAQKGVKLPGIDLRNGNLTVANFEDADLRDANLNGASLFYAKLVRANLTNSKLIHAFLTSLTYGEERGADLTMAVLKGANLKYALLSNVQFSAANLENADLTGAIMRKANLTGANLKGANLTEVSLSSANLTNAILIGSNFKDANLEKANFKDAKLENIHLEGALYSEETIWPKNFNLNGTGAVLNDFNYKVKQTRIAQEARARKEQQEREDRIKESQNPTPPHLPADCYRRFRSQWHFTYITVGNKTTGVNPTECSTIELIGSENLFLELILRVDYINENSLVWSKYIVDLVSNLLGERDRKAANNWLISQSKLARSSFLDIHTEHIFGDYLLSFRSKNHEGIREYSFTPFQRWKNT